MGRTPCCEKNSGLKKGPWTPDEDQKLIEYIKRHGYGSWRALPKRAGLLRCGKSCRLRWTNYLRPDIKRGRFSMEEEQTIVELHAALGNKWSTIATHLPGRTDNEIKNYWNTHLKKRLMQMGIDPVTHRRRADFMDLSNVPSFYDRGSLLSHAQQWENAMVAENLRQALLMADYKTFPAPTDLMSIANEQFNLQKSMSSSNWSHHEQGLMGSSIDYKGLPHSLEQVLQSQTNECTSNIKKWEHLLQQSIGYSCPSSGINPNGYINPDEYNGPSFISDFASMDVLKLKAEQQPPQMLRSDNIFLDNQEDHHHNILNVSDGDLKPKVSPFDESNLNATMWADQENPLQLVPPTFCTSNNTIYNQPELIPFMNTSRIFFNGE